MKRCEACRVKCRAYVNSKTGQLIKQTYMDSEKGKATIARNRKKPQSEATKLYIKSKAFVDRQSAKQKLRNASDHGKAVIERYKERRKSIDERRRKSGRYAISLQKYKKSWKYERLKLILAARLKARRQADPGMRIQDALMSCMYASLKGIHHSQSMSNLTEFVDSDDVAAFYVSKFKPGMRLSNFGWFWNQEHIIARSHYNWNDVEDIRRCNCKANLMPEYTAVNISKGKKLPPNDVLERLGVDVWPKAWNGKLPSANERKQLEKLNKRVVPGRVVVQMSMRSFVRGV